jgi:hypothetical protein
VPQHLARSSASLPPSPSPPARRTLLPLAALDLHLGQPGQPQPLRRHAPQPQRHISLHSTHGVRQQSQLQLARQSRQRTQPARAAPAAILTLAGLSAGGGSPGCGLLLRRGRLALALAPLRRLVRRSGRRLGRGRRRGRRRRRLGRRQRRRLNGSQQTQPRLALIPQRLRR